MTGAESVELGEEIQCLWSGYGVIQRARLAGSQWKNVVIKHIDVSLARKNRRGWAGEIAHQRKVRSYQVEIAFYRSHAKGCTRSCLVPEFVGALEKDNDSGWVLLLEDLDSAGYSLRRSQVSHDEFESCLSWLANFHATFLGCKADGLWPIGTYWHLDTRPEEYAAMSDGPLKSMAGEIDRRLNETKFRTWVHGDAKVANFCFATDGSSGVAAVDFQYVGGGCGMKDVAYFISSCLSDREAAEQEEPLLNFYFQELNRAVSARGINVDMQELEAEWRLHYPLAWADFCRFLAGWSPGHWKLNSYSLQKTEAVLAALGKGSSR